MKKIAVMLVLIIALVALGAAALADTMYINRSNQKSVTLYNGNDEAIATIPYRAAVEVYSRSQIDDQRTIVTYNGREGWVYTKYLSSTKPPKVTAQPTAKATPAPATENVYKDMKSVTHYQVVVHPSTAGSYVNFRWAPAKSAAIMGVRYEGDVLRVIAKNKSWAQVYDDATGECGYMMLSFLEEIK